MKQISYLIFPLLFLFACHTAPKEKIACPEGCGEKGAKPCPKNCIKAQTTETSTAKLDNIQFYIETSGSMNGYLKGGTEFKTLVTDMIATLKGMEKSGDLTINTISEKIAPYPGDADKFIKDIALVQIANQKSSEMHKIFKMLSERLQDKDVILFTSDCILSFPDADIKRNPKVNIESAPSTLKSFIKSTFQDYQQKGIVVNVYGFSSAFNGTYYDYQNKKTTLTNVQRPFYMWVIGKKDLVQKVCERLEAQPAFQPAKRMSFGTTAEPVKDYMLVPSLAVGRHYNCLSPYKEVVELELEKGAKAKGEEVWLAVNLAGLGSYVLDPAFLKSNLKVNGNDKVTVEIADVKKKEEVFGNVKNTKERELFANYSHAIKLKITNLIGNKGDITLQLPYKADNWYEQWSTMDDSNIKMETEPKTFAFVHLVNGIKEAYQLNSNPYLMEIKIGVSK